MINDVIDTLINFLIILKSFTKIVYYKYDNCILLK